MAPTGVDAAPDETTWGYTRIVRIEFARVDQRMRHNPLWTVPWGARWALIGRDQHGVTHLIGTNADTVNLLALARATATADRADFDEPPTCEYCALPVPAGARYCGAYEADCWLLDGRREQSWRAA